MTYHFRSRPPPSRLKDLLERVNDVADIAQSHNDIIEYYTLAIEKLNERLSNAGSKLSFTFTLSGTDRYFLDVCPEKASNQNIIQIVLNKKGGVTINDEDGPAIFKRELAALVDPLIIDQIPTADRLLLAKYKELTDAQNNEAKREHSRVVERDDDWHHPRV